ncbi:hypothetical protein [Kitasatospora sp. NPDC058190]|uniref:hypothetical protein n=1 Tax=Kitasatospora sp. NPDC058190 TaxID=3346371 RepID=UPI0036DA0AA1
MAGGGSASLEEARERLRAGAAPEVLRGELAARAPQWVDAVLAVGLALGIEEAELLRRLSSERELRSEFQPGEEDSTSAGCGWRTAPTALAREYARPGRCRIADPPTACVGLNVPTVLAVRAAARRGPTPAGGRVSACPMASA